MTVKTWGWVYIAPFPVWVGSLVTSPVRRFLFSPPDPTRMRIDRSRTNILDKANYRKDDTYSGHSF